MKLDYEQYLEVKRNLLEQTWLNQLEYGRMQF